MLANCDQENLPRVQCNLEFHKLYAEAQHPAIISNITTTGNGSKHFQVSQVKKYDSAKLLTKGVLHNSMSYFVFVKKQKEGMLTCCCKALSPKSETFKFPSEPRRRFSG